MGKGGRGFGLKVMRNFFFKLKKKKTKKTKVIEYDD